MKGSGQGSYEVGSGFGRSESQPEDIVLPAAIPSPEVAQQYLLAVAASQGDAGAFGELYQLYARPIYTYCAYRVESRADAEDLAAQVFLKGWQAIRQYQPEVGPILNWLYQIAHNLIVNHYKSRKYQSEVADASFEDYFLENIKDEHDPEAEVVEDLMRRMHKVALRQAVQNLPEEQQQVIYFRFVEDWSHAQIAALLGKKEGTVRAIQFRAISTLGKILAKEGYVGEQKRAE